MKDSTKQGVGQTVGFLESAAFAIPEAGPVIAAGLAGFDYLFEMLVSGSSRPLQRQKPALTQKDLELLLVEVKIALQEQSMKDALDEVVNIQSNLMTHWKLIEDDMRLWDVTKLNRLGTKVGWETLVRSDQEMMLSADNAITLLTTKCLELGSNEFALPIFLYAVNTYLILARVCIIGEFGLLQMDHDLQQARANLAAKIAEADKSAKGKKKDTGKSLSSGILGAIHKGKIDPHNKNAKVPKEVVEAAVDVIKAMPTKEISANTSVFAKLLQSKMHVWHGYIRTYTYVSTKTSSAMYDAINLAYSEIEVTKDSSRRIARVKAPGEKDAKRLETDHPDYIKLFKALMYMQYFDYSKETTINSTGVMDMTLKEMKMVQKAQKIFKQMYINTTTALTSFQQADAHEIHPDLDRALRNLY